MGSYLIARWNIDGNSYEKYQEAEPCYTTQYFSYRTAQVRQGQQSKLPWRLETYGAHINTAATFADG